MPVLKPILLLSAASLLTACLLGCSPGSTPVAGADPEFPGLIPFKRLDPAFVYRSRGYGNDLQNNLLLIGPEEVLRWNTATSRFERFGGPVPGASDGAIQRDSAGNLYLISTDKHYQMSAGESLWKPLSADLPPLTEPNQVYRNPVPRLLIDGSGSQWLIGLVNENRRNGTVFYHRESSTAPLRKVAETWSDQAAGADLGASDQLGLRSDGTLFYQTSKGLFALAKNASAPQPVFSCASPATDHCQVGLLLITRQDSPDVYLAKHLSGEISVYKLPTGTVFPLVPTKIAPMPGEGIPTAGMIRFRIDGRNRLWGMHNQESAQTVNRPPYVLDVTTINRLEGSGWKQVGRVLTPFYAWDLSHDGTKAYVYGKQFLGGLNGGTEISEALLP